ncbi:MAG: D-aminoacyl-tRNA deacylase [Candidatus Bathyarchaeia archaeon]
MPRRPYYTLSSHNFKNKADRGILGSREGLLSFKNLIVASRLDLASRSIAQRILSLYDFKESSTKICGEKVYEGLIDGEEASLAFVDSDITDTQFLEGIVKPSLLIFVSRHESQRGTPILSTHVPGNLGSAEHGGLPKKVSIAPARAMKAALKALEFQRQERGLPYIVSYEATHHGPSLDIPTIFIEIGSTPKEWGDPKACEAVALSVEAAIKASRIDDSSMASIGIGGLHYNEKFTKIGLREGLALGHMIPKYAMPSIDAEVLRQCVERTLEAVEVAILDWKGIPSGPRRWIHETLKGLGLDIRRV